jgi:hypothetical protein
MRLLLGPIMFLVSRIRNEKHNYLTVPEEILSWVKLDQIMKIGHLLPSIVLTLIISLKLLPLFSVGYAEQLEQNTGMIPLTIILILFPLLIINGFIIESALLSTNKRYKDFKNNNN